MTSRDKLMSDKVGRRIQKASSPCLSNRHGTAEWEKEEKKDKVVERTDAVVRKRSLTRMDGNRCRG
jgi:hypothetical protein